MDGPLGRALTTGAGLYEIVETYAGFGDHHTGTDADHQTTDWLAGILERLGADVALPDYRFERYLCQASLTCSGQTVPSVPVFYSGYGVWETDRVEVIRLEPTIAGQPTGLSSFTDAVAGDRPLVIALDGPDDQPVQCNRVPPVNGRSTEPGRPAVIIPGNWADRASVDPMLSFDGALETATTRNIVATLGSPDQRRVTITTPLTGWTPCAGERGTGLAAAIAMAADLAQDHHVTLVGASGHELDHLGLRTYLATENVVGQPVIHLGASVGAVEWDTAGEATLGSGRLVLTNAPETVREGINERAAEGRWTPFAPEEWPGEGGTWLAAGATVLSFLGSFEHFHVASDLPEVATTPGALERASRSAIHTARHFLSSGK